MTYYIAVDRLTFPCIDSEEEKNALFWHTL